MILKLDDTDLNTISRLRASKTTGTTVCVSQYVPRNTVVIKRRDTSLVALSAVMRFGAVEQSPLGGDREGRRYCRIQRVLPVVAGLNAGNSLSVLLWNVVYCR
jgi:hypothetical protein